MVQVYEDQNPQRREEDEENSGSEVETETAVGHPKRKCRERFDHGILPGNFRVAGAAFAPQQNITDYRNVVIGFDGVPAVGTVRVGKHDRLSKRNPRDTNVQEASHHQTYQKQCEICHKHGLLIDFSYSGH
jgi:hypothetical protein